MAVLVPGGIITFSHTIFLWQSVVSVARRDDRGYGGDVARDSAGRRRPHRPGLGSRSRTRRTSSRRRRKNASTPGAWLEHSPILTWFVVALGVAYLARYFMQAGEPLNAINLNILNFAFLLAGFLLHRTPARLMQCRAERDAGSLGHDPSVSFLRRYRGHHHRDASERSARRRLRELSTPTTFPPLIAIYSAVLGVFVPSGGSKWVIMAPYVMSAAHSLKVHLGWVVCAYDLGEALANLVQPFWMLPMLSLFRLGARDVMGYTFVVFLGSYSSGVDPGDGARPDARISAIEQRDTPLFVHAKAMVTHDLAHLSDGFGRHVKKSAHAFAAENQAADIVIGLHCVIDPSLGESRFQPQRFSQPSGDINKAQFTIFEKIGVLAHAALRR